MKGPAKSLHVFLGSVELEVIDGVAFASPAHPRRHHRVAKRGISVLLAVAGVTVVTTGVAAGVMTVTTRPVAHVPAHAHANATAIRVPRLDNDSGTSNPTPSPHGLLDSRPTSSSSSSSSSSTTSTTSTSSTLPASGVLATAADSRQSASETDSPKTSILVPGRGATVSGSVALAASASSNARSLKFYLLGGSYGYSGRMLCAATLTEAGWACELNTTTVPNGSYSLVSDASNTSGSDFSAGVNITVSNGTALAGSTSTARSATGAVAATPSHADAQSATTAYEAGVAYEAVVAAIHERGGLEGVYVAPADPSGVAAFGAATGTSPTIASDYLPYNDGWVGMDGSGGSLNWMFAQGWTGSGYTLSLGVPIIPSDSSGNPVGTLAQGATGAYNSYYVTLAQTLIAAGESNAYLRLGWEFDGNWYAWSAQTPSAEAEFAAYFQQIVTSMRSVPGGNFKFVWNPDADAFTTAGYNVELAYPGNAYVNLIGLDAYDMVWISDPTPANAWDQVVLPELTAAHQFAAAEGEPLAITEWAEVSGGNGLGDDPLYMNNIIAWMKDPANDVLFESYFSFTGSEQLTDGSFAKSLAAFTADLG